jgi:hypothetical protein
MNSYCTFCKSAISNICLEAFMATEFNKVFLGRQLHQSVKIFSLYKTESVPISRVFLKNISLHELIYLHMLFNMQCYFAMYNETTTCTLSSSMCFFIIVVSLRMTYPRLKHGAVLDTQTLLFKI